MTPRSINPPGHNMSRSLLVEPEVQFQTQQADEKVYLVVRKHPFTQLSWMLYAIVLSVFLLLISFILPQFFGFTARQTLLIDVFGVVFIVSYVWLNILLWYFTVGIITNLRILDFDFYNVIYKEFSASIMSHVSETTTKIGGFFGSIFDFGDVFVKTEGFEPNIEFDDIPQPSFVVKVINNLMVEEPK